MDSKDRQAHATGPSQVSRRSVAKGTAWAVPAITSMTLVPAFAASAQRKQVTITFDAKKHKETIQCVRVPAEATDIRYSIRGGAGGAGPRTAGANGADPVPKYKARFIGPAKVRPPHRSSPSGVWPVATGPRPHGTIMPSSSQPATATAVRQWVCPTTPVPSQLSNGLNVGATVAAPVRQ